MLETETKPFTLGGGGVHRDQSVQECVCVHMFKREKNRLFVSSGISAETTREML